jgi:hypothetical protein
VDSSPEDEIHCEYDNAPQSSYEAWNSMGS